MNTTANMGSHAEYNERRFKLKYNERWSELR